MTQLYCDTTCYRGRIWKCAWGIGTQFFISDMTGLYWDMTQLYCDTTCYRGRIWKWTWGTDWPACLPSCMAMLSAACESCYISMSHVSRINESCLTYACAISCMSAILHGDVERCVWVMSHVNESCLTYEWVMSHKWIRHVMRVCYFAWRCWALRVSHVTCQWVMSHVWMSHVTCQWVFSHTWMSHISHMNVSCVPSCQAMMSAACESCHMSMSHVSIYVIVFEC